MKNRVIVLGQNYSTILGAIRGLKDEFDLGVIFIPSIRKKFRYSDSKIVASSRYVSKFIKQTEKDGDVIIQKINSEYSDCPRQTLLFPTDDYTSSLIDQNRQSFSENILLPHTSNTANGTIDRLMDKSVQINLARSFDLRTADSWIIESDMNIDELPQNIKYPCFFKPLISYNGGKNGMKKCVSEKELKKELAAFRKIMQASVMVQEYLEIEQEYSISGICFGGHVFLPALLRKLRVSQSHKGTTVYGVIEDFSQIGPVYQQLIDLLRSINLYSIIDIEIFKCGDQFYFNEINFRTSAVCYGAVAGGANIPALFAEAMFSGKFEPPEIHMAYGKKFLCEKAVWDDYIEGNITRPELEQMYREADIFIIRNEEDPEPEKHFRRFIFQKKIRHDIKMLRNYIVQKNRFFFDNINHHINIFFTLS